MRINPVKTIANVFAATSMALSPMAAKAADDFEFHLDIPLHPAVTNKFSLMSSTNLVTDTFKKVDNVDLGGWTTTPYGTITNGVEEAGNAIKEVIITSFSQVKDTPKVFRIGFKAEDSFENFFEKTATVTNDLDKAKFFKIKVTTD